MILLIDLRAKSLSMSSSSMIEQSTQDLRKCGSGCSSEKAWGTGETLFFVAFQSSPTAIITKPWCALALTCTSQTLSLSRSASAVKQMPSCVIRYHLLRQHQKQQQQCCPDSSVSQAGLSTHSVMLSSTPPLPSSLRFSRPCFNQARSCITANQTNKRERHS